MGLLYLYSLLDKKLCRFSLLGKKKNMCQYLILDRKKVVGAHPLTKNIGASTYSRQKNGVSTHSLTEKWCRYSLFDKKMVSVLTLWQENDVATHSLAKNMCQYLLKTEKWCQYSLLDRKMVSVLSPWQKKWCQYSLLDRKMVSVLTPWQKNGVSTHSLTEKWCRCSLLDRKFVLVLFDRKYITVPTPLPKKRKKGCR